MRAGQRLTPADMVIKPKAKADHPARPPTLGLWQDKPQRPADMRRNMDQPLALLQGFPHKAELVIFQIAQSAMDQLGAGRGSVRRQIIALDQQDLEPAPNGIAGNTRAIDPAADHQQIIVFATESGLNGSDGWVSHRRS